MPVDEQGTNRVRPLVSVIIPSLNEEGSILQCLESVLAWDTSAARVEILVVDGSSTDRTREIIAEFQRAHPQIRLLDNPRRHKPHALNLGLRAAQGDWIMRLDAHSQYPPDYLQACLEAARSTGADNVGGWCVPRLQKETIQAVLVQALTTHPFGVGDSGFRTFAPAGQADTVPFGFFRRDVFDRVGSFDERLIHAQDYEFNRRLRRAGGTIWRSPSIRVFYSNQASLGAFLSKVLSREGPWNAYMWSVAPYAFRLRHGVPALFTAVLVSAAILAAFVPGGGVLLAAILLPYAILALVAAMQQSVRFKRWWLVPLLPPSFLAYHLAYGLGEWWGLLQLVLGRAPVQRMVDQGQ